MQSATRGRDTNRVINVTAALDVSTLTVMGASAAETGILLTGCWIDSGPEDPHDGPHTPLCA